MIFGQNFGGAGAGAGAQGKWQYRCLLILERLFLFVSARNNISILVSSKIWPGFLDSTWVQSSKYTLRPEESSSSNILPQVLLRDRFYLVTALTCRTVLGLAVME